MWEDFFNGGCNSKASGKVEKPMSEDEKDTVLIKDLVSRVERLEKKPKEGPSTPEEKEEKKE